MSLKDRLKQLSRTGMAGIALMSGMATAKAQTANESKPNPIVQEAKGFTFDGDNKLNGFTLAPTDDLKIVQGSSADILDPNKEHRSESYPDLIAPESQLNDGYISSQDTYDTQSKTKQDGTLEFSQNSQSEIIAGDVNLVRGETGAVLSMSNSKIGEMTTEKGNKTIDKLDGMSVLLTTQTDVLNFQNWCEKTTNDILKQEGPLEDKQAALKTIGHVFAASQSELLATLPNPDNVKPRTGDMKKTVDLYNKIAETPDKYKDGVNVGEELKKADTQTIVNQAVLNSLKQR